MSDQTFALNLIAGILAVIVATVLVRVWLRRNGNKKSAIRLPSAVQIPSVAGGCGSGGCGVGQAPLLAEMTNANSLAYLNSLNDGIGAMPAGGGICRHSNDGSSLAGKMACGDSKPLAIGESNSIFPIGHSSVHSPNSGSRRQGKNAECLTLLANSGLCQKAAKVNDGQSIALKTGVPGTAPNPSNVVGNIHGTYVGQK